MFVTRAQLKGEHNKWSIFLSHRNNDWNIVVIYICWSSSKKAVNLEVKDHDAEDDGVDTEVNSDKYITDYA